ncbi:MAG: monofunctional biosynthetic peptidoglycan transglycosylase [Rhodobacteraceae bacterium]|nr:monofunctional biosynthetic peptidoglycan transglycosylase [Paracoccaceae bacterium]
MAKPAAKRGTARPRKASAPAPSRGLRQRIVRWLLRGLAVLAGIMVALVMLFDVVNPPTTPYMLSERIRLGHLDQQWVPMAKIAPVMARSVVASEDANFCRHWGFDLAAIRAAAEAGGSRGGSTITQQVVKNVFLWQGHSWPRKALEALMTPVVELFWSKRRILEVYLNVAEFGVGTFGVTAGAARSFAVEPGAIGPHQAALLASVLPDPKRRNAAHPTAYMRKHAQEVADGAQTIEADGRATCFEH